MLTETNIIIQGDVYIILLTLMKLKDLRNKVIFYLQLIFNYPTYVTAEYEFLKFTQFQHIPSGCSTIINL
jgi:hypothetical protein